MMRSRADMAAARAAAKRALRADPKKNDNWIAREVGGISDKTVRRIRAALEADGELPPMEETNRVDGRTQRAHYMKRTPINSQSSSSSSKPSSKPSSKQGHHGEPVITVQEIRDKLRPLARALWAECGRERAAICTYDVRILAYRIREQITEWTVGPPRLREWTSKGRTQHAPKQMENKT